MRRAQERLASIDHASIASPFGTIEYAERGEGQPILVLHGIYGGFDAACQTVDPWIGDGFRAVAPSRFGCLGSPLPPNATTADQGGRDRERHRRRDCGGRPAGGTAA